MTKENIDRLRYLDYLIRTRATGTPQQLAEKLGISKRSWFNLRDTLVNDLNWPLGYDFYCETYHYTENVKFEIGLKRLSGDRAGKITGGAKLFSENFTECNLIALPSFSFALNL
jgi:hypothetical protein